MNSEKVKEIKKALEDNANDSEHTHLAYIEDYRVKLVAFRDILTLINELESELEKEQINNLNCDTELQYKEKRIAELEKENDEKYKRIMELEQDLVHADEKVFYRECNVALKENEIKQQAIKQFAEKVKDSLEEYRLENEYFTEHEPNGNLWQMNSSVFCIEVTQDGGLIDQLAKECLNES